MDKTASFDAAAPDHDALHEIADTRPGIPAYLENNYWWAYLNPRCVKFFEHQWIVNLILWGNFPRLRDAALEELGSRVVGRTLQIACVYGDFTPKLAERLAPRARLDVVDVAPIQLTNLRGKMGDLPHVHLHRQDASDLSFPDGTFDQVVLFFLLHELPDDVRRSAVAEALRVVKPGGRVVFVDYHRPVWPHPHRYLMYPILKGLEPFALDLWRKEIADCVAADQTPSEISKDTFFGGLYQRVVMTR
jgi:ubiquinone/menaquinone biosynthesis C-methylase UbiE